MMPAGFITEVWFQARLVLKKTFLSARIIYTLGASTRYRQKLVPRYLPQGTILYLATGHTAKRQLHADD